MKYLFTMLCISVFFACSPDKKMENKNDTINKVGSLKQIEDNNTKDELALRYEKEEAELNNAVKELENLINQIEE